MAAVAAEVKRQVSYSGTFIKAACNDFNLNDPEIFAVAKFVDKDRQIGHLFIYLMFNGRVNKCATKHIDTEDLPEDLIQKLSRLSISLE